MMKNQILTKIAHCSVAKRPTGGFQTLQQIRKSSFGTIENLSIWNGKITGLATGFVGLDRMTSGLQNGELSVIAAAPSMGGTSFALNIAQNAAVHQNAIVGIFSLELNKQLLLQRIVGLQAELQIPKIMYGFLSGDDIAKLESALEKLDMARISIDDTKGISLGKLRERARRLRKDQHGLDLIVVDSPQLMSTTSLLSDRSVYKNRAQDISAISHGLNSLARELNVPVIAVLRLPVVKNHRGGDRRPMLSDLHLFGSIKRDADLVIFIHRESYYCAKEEISGAESHKAEAIVAKHYNGLQRTFYLDFIPSFTRFSDL
jgi:replicative DNA helicase